MKRNVRLIGTISFVMLAVSTSFGIAQEMPAGDLLGVWRLEKVRGPNVHDEFPIVITNEDADRDGKLEVYTMALFYEFTPTSQEVYQRYELTDPGEPVQGGLARMFNPGVFHLPDATFNYSVSGKTITFKPPRSDRPVNARFTIDARSLAIRLPDGIELTLIRVPRDLIAGAEEMKPQGGPRPPAPPPGPSQGNPPPGPAPGGPPER